MLGETRSHEQLNHYSNEDEIDIITLRYTLIECRKQLLILINSLLDTEFAYGKVELREDFDRLKVQCDSLKDENDLLKDNFQELIENCKYLVQQTTGILHERDDYYSEWQYAKDILTPRPDWDKCSCLITHWSEQSIGKTSEQLVDILINEIVYGNTEENNEEYLPMIINNRNEDNTFLQELCIDAQSKENVVRNRQLRRRITGLLIKEIWSNKLYNENKLEMKSNIKLTDYVFDYLTKRFDNKELAIEIGYNLRDACHRYRNRYEINLFWRILIGQVEENVYHYENREFARILQYLTKRSSKFTISWSVFTNALHELYPNWIDERIEHLIKSAERDSQQLSTEKSELNLLLLFMEDDEGHIGEFLMDIREQLQLDKNDYIEKIKDLLIGYPLVTVNQFKQAVRLIDPLILKTELRRYVMWVFELKEKAILMDDKPIKDIQSRDFEEILIRLEHCACFMH